MKRLICLAIAAMLMMSAAAGAEGMTREDVRAEKGIWSAEAYADIEPDWLERAYGLRESVREDGGMTVWEIPSGIDEHGWHELYSMPWLQSMGIAAEVVIDFDGDGAMEWVTAETRPREGEFYANRPVLWVSVYEMDGESVRLADEWLVSDSPIDSVGDGMQLVFMEMDGVTALVSMNAYSIDGRWHKNWAVVYDGEKMGVAGGFSVSFDEAGGARLEEVGPDSAALAAESGPWGAGVERWSHYEADEDELFIRMLTDAAGMLGLGVAYEEGNVYGFQLLPAITGYRTMMSIDCYALDDDGNSVVRVERSVPQNIVRTEGMVHLRNEPSLEGDIVGGAQEGARLAYLGEAAIDSRGVAWYKVRYDGGEAWVSSKFAELK